MADTRLGSLSLVTYFTLCQRSELVPVAKQGQERTQSGQKRRSLDNLKDTCRQQKVRKWK